MPATRAIVAGCAIAAVVVTVSAALVMLDTPAEERVHRMDERRVQDLRLIADAANLYWTRHGRLPATLAELADQSAGAAFPAGDPASREAYRYRPIEDRSFELCATFERDSPEGGSGRTAVDFWSHKAGTRCFTLKARETVR